MRHQAALPTHLCAWSLTWRWVGECGCVCVWGGGGQMQQPGTEAGQTQWRSGAKPADRRQPASSCSPPALAAARSSMQVSIWATMRRSISRCRGGGTEGGRLLLQGAVRPKSRWQDGRCNAVGAAMLQQHAWEALADGWRMGSPAVSSRGGGRAASRAQAGGGVLWCLGAGSHLRILPLGRNGVNLIDEHDGGRHRRRLLEQRPHLHQTRKQQHCSSMAAAAAAAAPLLPPSL